MNAYFLVYFTHNSFLNRLSNLGKSGYKSIIAVSSSGIFGKKYPIAICDSHYNCRAYLRINCIFTIHAMHHTFIFTMKHQSAASSAIPVITIPAIQVVCRNCRKCKFFWLRIAEYIYTCKIITFNYIFILGMYSRICHFSKKSTLLHFSFWKCKKKLLLIIIL